MILTVFYLEYGINVSTNGIEANMIKKIAIIGGGNAGLMAAIGLQQSGFEVQVFEKAQKFYPLGGDIGLWPNGLQILDKFGLYERILQHSGNYPTIKIGTEQDEFISEVSVKAYHQIAPYDPINICRYELQEILLQALGEQNIFYNKQCINIRQNSQQVLVDFKDGTSITADLLIGADGANSLVRKYVQSHSTLKYAGYLSMGGINTQPHQIKYNLIYGKHFSGSYPVGNNRQLFFFSTQHRDCDIEKIYPTISVQFNLFRQQSLLLDDMLDKLEKSIQLTNGINYFFVKNHYLSPLKQWINGRIVLIGDAAQLVGPILGCSTSVILEGVDVLITHLRREKNYNKALEVYQKIQQPRANNFLQLAKRYAKHIFGGKGLGYLNYHKELIEFLSRKSAESLEYPV